MPINAGLTTEPPRFRGLARVSALDRLVLAEMRLLDRPRRPERPLPRAAPEPEVDPGTELETDSAPDAMLEPEEEAFVASTAAWLAGRSNADVLIDAIWARAHSELPEREGAPRQESPTAQDLGEPPPDPAP